MESKIPMWAQYLLGNQEAVNSFNKWIDERKIGYAVETVANAEDFASVKGVRYLMGELEVLRQVVNFLPEEAQRKKDSGNE